MGSCVLALVSLKVPGKNHSQPIISPTKEEQSKDQDLESNPHVTRWLLFKIFFPGNFINIMILKIITMSLDAMISVSLKSETCITKCELENFDLLSYR